MERQRREINRSHGTELTFFCFNELSAVFQNNSLTELELCIQLLVEDSRRVRVGAGGGRSWEMLLVEGVGF